MRRSQVDKTKYDDANPCADQENHSAAMLARCWKCEQRFCLACGQGDDECADLGGQTHDPVPCVVCGDPYDPAHTSTLPLDHEYRSSLRAEFKKAHQHDPREPKHEHEYAFGTEHAATWGVGKPHRYPLVRADEGKSGA
jgi:hypothetical protein